MIAIENRQKICKIDLRRLRGSLRRLLKVLNRQDSEVSVLLVDDEQIREMNRTYLKKDRHTNVISFAMTEGEYGAVSPNLLGDIIISVETASRDAVQGNIGFLDEIEFLMIHGLLHLLGYEHEEVSQTRAREMKARERELFAYLGHGELDPETDLI